MRKHSPALEALLANDKRTDKDVDEYLENNTKEAFMVAYEGGIKHITQMIRQCIDDKKARIGLFKNVSEFMDLEIQREEGTE